MERVARCFTPEERKYRNTEEIEHIYGVGIAADRPKANEAAKSQQITHGIGCIPLASRV